MSVVVVATIHPAPEHRDEVIALFEETIAAVHANDAGCELYALHEDTDTLVLIEKWSGAEDLESHRVGDTMKSLDPKLAGKLTDKTVVKMYQPHPAGSPEQGAL
jgi:quinol monooxygenase YgiN